MHELKQFLDNINLSELFTSAERWQDIFRTDFVDRSTLRERCSFGMTYPEARDIESKSNRSICRKKETRLLENKVEETLNVHPGDESSQSENRLSVCQKNRCKMEKYPYGNQSSETKL